MLHLHLLLILYWLSFDFSRAEVGIISLSEVTGVTPAKKNPLREAVFNESVVVEDNSSFATAWRELLGAFVRWPSLVNGRKAKYNYKALYIQENSTSENKDKGYKSAWKMFEVYFSPPTNNVKFTVITW